MRAADMETWTPKRVEEVMIEAIRWARHNAGPTGPAPVRSLMPVYRPTAQDRIDEGWDDPVEESEDERVVYRQKSAEEVQFFINALYWPARYAAKDLPQSSRILNMWLKCRVYKLDFARSLKERGGVSRATAYRYRDKALSAISQGLARDGVPLP